MVFSSPTFLYLFLPTVLLAYYLAPKVLRNVFLLVVSLFFYAWGEGMLVLLMAGSILMNFLVGRAIGFQQAQAGTVDGKPQGAFPMLWIGIALNLSVLLYFKYTNFILDTMTGLGVPLNLEIGSIVLPIGISFFTFQSISYLVDVYRGTVKPQRNVLDLGMYIALFPQLIAGPIVRYKDISAQIRQRTVDGALFTSGLVRFIIGLGKKVLIANNAGAIADRVFEISGGELSTPIVWLGIVCYAIQIYFDFAGYSDMAIGLGRMLGFRFLENFNFPYISRSIKEFWRRWHISLSSWFKDYLYIPLGGNRRGTARTYLNLIIVFFITGLWHGASWNFVVWGLFHGAFLILERIVRIPLPSWLGFLRHLYVLLVVLVGWVFFRAEDLGYGLTYIQTMFSWQPDGDVAPLLYLNAYSITMLGLGILLSMPVGRWMERWINASDMRPVWYQVLQYGVCLLLLAITMLELAQATYNPFIYFRF